MTLNSLYFFTRVCEHLVLLVQGRRREFFWFTTAAMGLMLLLHRILPWLHVFSQHLVTREEQLRTVVNSMLEARSEIRSVE